MVVGGGSARDHALVAALRRSPRVDRLLFVPGNSAVEALEDVESAPVATQDLPGLVELAEMEAISKQDYTDAVQTLEQAQASIAQSRATLESARVNLRFTTVPAPITGRIGRSLFTVGALVSTTQADPLATIQQLDPIFVDIQQSSADLLALRRSLASGGAAPASADVRLRLEDGSDYGQVGRVELVYQRAQ